MSSPGRSPAPPPASRRAPCRPSGRRTASPTMKTAAKRTIAKRRFVPGPAKITSTRFQVAARQYASRAERVVELGQAALRARGAPASESGLAQRRSSSPSAVRAPRRSLRGDVPLHASTACTSAAPRAAPARSARPGRTAPAGASRGSSRSRRAGSRRSRTRCRCASSSRSRAGSRCRTCRGRMPDRARGEEVARLVDEDENARPRIATRMLMPTAAPSREARGLPRRPRRGRRGHAPAAPSTSAERLLDRRRRSRGTASRPSRNAATATSFAALNAHG